MALIDSVSIAERLERVRHQIREACAQAGRSEHEVRLLPVTKTHPSSTLREAIRAGCSQFGENRVQEMEVKAADLAGEATWVLIGHLQRNKAQRACQIMSELQSLDSLSLAQTLDRRLAAISPQRRLAVLVEVNTSAQPTKSGITPEEVDSFTKALRAYPHLNPRGLMTVADPDPVLAARGFALLAQLRARLQDRDGAGWHELSMGMSQDFQSAIAYGSTCVRLGTAIFGRR